MRKMILPAAVFLLFGFPLQASHRFYGYPLRSYYLPGRLHHYLSGYGLGYHRNRYGLFGRFGHHGGGHFSSFGGYGGYGGHGYGGFGGYGSGYGGYGSGYGGYGSGYGGYGSGYGGYGYGGYGDSYGGGYPAGYDNNYGAYPGTQRRGYEGIVSGYVAGRGYAALGAYPTVVLGVSGSPEVVRANFSDLIFSVTPGQALVYMDGKLIGSARSFATTRDRYTIMDGEHQLRIEYPGYQTFETTLQVVPNRTLHIDLQLQQLR